jgi:hypothetical protein
MLLLFSYSNLNKKKLTEIIENSKYDIRQIKFIIENIQDKKILGIKDLEMDALESINLCLDKIAPIKQVNVRATVNLPWYDKQLINLAHKRNRLYNKWYDNKTQIDRAKYVESRNKYNSVFRDKKSNYYKEFVCENSASTKSFWQKLNHFLNPNKKE